MNIESYLVAEAYYLQNSLSTRSVFPSIHTTRVPIRIDCSISNFHVFVVKLHLFRLIDEKCGSNDWIRIHESCISFKKS